MEQRIILLDIDGVMVTTASWRPEALEQGEFYAFSPLAQQQLDWLLQYSEAHIILTSTYRNRFSNEGWRKIFSERCAHLQSIQVLDDFKLQNRQHSRLADVTEWVRRYGANTHYVIIDDDSALEALPPDIKTQWVRTMPKVGLDVEAAMEALTILRPVKPG
ncbi:HAD domain-containing protein [Chitinophaga costaii]|uniref:HAD domain-containing protein n=1 Tax=Chitinophaga costaii TaxID=1335309 RepID=UPI000F4E46B8|nr:HAD domain-containing protein [Chitinophaga costaii]